jgi:hypothetical protein
MVKCTVERVRIFVAEQVCSFIQFKRALAEVKVRKFPACLAQYSLERDAALC